MKKRLIFIVILLLILLPVSVMAENKIYFDKDEITIAPNNTYTVKLLVDSNTDFTKVNFNVITTSEYINFNSVTINPNFNRLSSNGYSLEAKTPQKSGTEVATIILKASSNAPINSTGNIRVINSTLTSDQTYNLQANQTKVTVGEEVKSNYLLSLSSKIATIDFKKNVTTYNVEVESDVEEFDLVAITEDSNATATISDQKLTKNKNIITIKVSRKDLEDKVYKVIVNKKNNENDEKDTTNNIGEEKDEVKEINVKARWVPILIGLFIVLIFDLAFIKKNK